MARKDWAHSLLSEVRTVRAYGVRGCTHTQTQKHGKQTGRQPGKQIGIRQTDR